MQARAALAADVELIRSAGLIAVERLGHLLVVLDHPDLPLTNNEAERALRHWVIARRISLGTRTAQGTRAFAYLASVIETCRKRAASPWPYLAEVIRLRRQGLQAPPLPAPTS